MSSGAPKDIRLRNQPHSLQAPPPHGLSASAYTAQAGGAMNTGGPPSSATHRANRSLLFGSGAGSASSAGPRGYAVPGGSGSSGASGAFEREMLERDNNAQVDGLNDKVGVMKDLAIQIGNEVEYQNRMLDKMDSGFDSAQGLLGGTLERLNDMVASGNGGTPLCYLVAFILAVFFALYLLFRN